MRGSRRLMGQCLDGGGSPDYTTKMVQRAVFSRRATEALLASGFRPEDFFEPRTVVVPDSVVHEAGCSKAGDGACG